MIVSDLVFLRNETFLLCETAVSALSDLFPLPLAFLRWLLFCRKLGMFLYFPYAAMSPRSVRTHMVTPGCRVLLDVLSSSGHIVTVPHVDNVDNPKPSF